MSSSTKILIGVLCALLVVAGVVAAAVASPYLAVHRLRAALIAGDEEEIRDRVDFVRVREAMKEDVVRRMTEEAQEDAAGGDKSALVGLAFAGGLAERVIDTYVTPEGIARIARSGKRSALGDAGSAPDDGKDAPPMDWGVHCRKWSQCVAEVRRPGEKTGLNLYLGRRGLFSWQLERIVFVEPPQRPNEAKVFKSLGCKYSARDRAALCRVPAGNASSGSAFAPGSVVFSRLVGIYDAGAGDEARVLALVESVPTAAGDYSCHVCSVLLGGVQYRLAGDRWKVEAANLAVTEGGEFGELKADVKVAELGKERYALAIQGSTVGQGYEYSYATLLGLRGEALRDLGTVRYQTGDASGMGRCKNGTSTSPSNWRIDAAAGGELFDVVVDHGAEVCEDLGTRATRTVAPAWTERWKFDGESYKSTNPRDAAD